MYEIAVRGRLPEDWPHGCDGCTVATTQSSVGLLTTLVGPVADQPERHGVLVLLRGLALPIEWGRRGDDLEVDHPKTSLDT